MCRHNVCNQSLISGGFVVVVVVVVCLFVAGDVCLEFSYRGCLTEPGAHK